MSSEVSTSKLNIQIPQSLYREGGYDHREALFGVPPYGGSIAQKVYYYDNEAALCDPKAQVDPKDGYPTRTDEKGNKLPWESPFILMIDAGQHCSFVQAVRAAQHAGAAAVLIADNLCLCDDLDCIHRNSNQQCRSTEPIMADDGSGGDISIPSFLMSKHDADLIKETVKSKSQMVQVEMAWKLPNVGDRVVYEIWDHPAEKVSMGFFRDFKVYAEALAGHASFTPNLFLVDGSRSGCRSAAGENMCLNLCTNQGRYCFPDPDNNIQTGSSGADVVEETLRRLCIWDQYGSDGVGSPFFEYIAQFDEMCLSQRTHFSSNKSCIQKSMKAAKIDARKIDDCMKASGGLDGDRVNTVLSKQLDALATRAGYVIIPSVNINNAVMRGGLTAPNVFAAICSSFAEGTVPDVCTACAHCPNAEACLKTKSCSQLGPSEVSTPTFVSSLFLMVVFMGSLFVWQQRRRQAEMRNHVRSILADYVPLQDQDDGPPTVGFTQSYEEGSFVQNNDTSNYMS
ncbi:hypothetical protein FisN_9Hh348 [Fistulifera solaris]|uniref:Uncharacterized protein n=1 Tax=Fistulifera solaris TaxID=1519565 RepID=A0A1Z5KD10_FISSO|nr:hypothetical protein FisN_9Hh348 [Fistulifera solaris]|eukprot:GAX24096.1 hypothetical protein FisN_9Hh348 [Fistulifera solaris]